MGAVWLRARALLRGRLLASLLLTLVVGLAGGVVLAAVAGARRSDTALARFLAASDTVNATVIWDTSVELTNRTDRAEELAVVSDLPQVRTAHRVSFVILSDLDPTGPAGPARPLALVGLDRPGHEALGRPLLVTGHWPRPDHLEEALVDEEFASQHGLHAGGRFESEPTPGPSSPRPRGASMFPRRARPPTCGSPASCGPQGSSSIGRGREPD